MQPQILREEFQRIPAADAVAPLIQPGGKGGQPHPALGRGQNAAAHAAFCGQAHLDGKFARGIVHTAGHHQGFYNAADPGVHQLPAGGGVLAVAGQHQAVVGQIPHVHVDGAHLKIQLHHVLGIPFQQVFALHKIGHGPVAPPGLILRGKHLLVQADGLPPAQRARQAEKRPEGVGAALDAAAGGGNGPGVDHGVHGVGGQGLQPDHGVEGVAGGLHAHLAEHPVVSGGLQGQNQGNGLGNALDGKLGLAVALAILLPVRGADADTQLGGVTLGQFRNVGGHLALVHMGAGVALRILQGDFNVLVP